MFRVEVRLGLSSSPSHFFPFLLCRFSASSSRRSDSGRSLVDCAAPVCPVGGQMCDLCDRSAARCVTGRRPDV